MASVIKKSLQRKDYVVRIDNDFVAFLPKTTKNQGKIIFNVIKAKIETNNFFEMKISLEFDISEKTYITQDIVDVFIKIIKNDN